MKRYERQEISSPETQLWLSDLRKITSALGDFLSSWGLMLPLSLWWGFYERFVDDFAQGLAQGKIVMVWVLAECSERHRQCLLSLSD